MEPGLFHQLVLALAALVMILAAGSDAARFRIPNLACLTLLLLFPLFAVLSPAPIDALGHAATFAILLVVGYGFYAAKLAGAGDIKFLAVCGLWAGPSFLGPFLAVTALAGGVLSLGFGALALARHRLFREQAPVRLAQTPVPYGVAIALGGLCSLALLTHPDLLAKV